MKTKKQYKKGNSSGPGPLLVLAILVVLVIVIFFLANYLVSKLPADFGANKIGDTATTTEDKVVSDEISFKTLNQGAHSPYHEGGGLLITKADDFKKVWTQVVGGSVPTIDFDNESVLAVFMGDKVTTGYNIKIKKVILKDGMLSVTVDEITPGKNCNVSASKTNPYHIVSIPKSESKVEFVTGDVVLDCE